MAIRTGIGVGAAQIADTSNITNAYARRIAQEQRNQAILAEREAKAAEAAQKKIEKQDELYREELADLIGSIKTEGVRDQDLPDITNSYNQIKELYRKGASLTNPNERALFRAELNNNIKALNEYAQRSVKFGKDLYGLSQDIAQREWDYEPSSVSLLRRMNSMSLKDLGPEAVIDQMKFKRVPNFGLIEKAIDDTYSYGKDVSNFAGIRREQGKEFAVNKVDPVLIQTNLVNKIQSNPEAFSALNRLYTQQTGDVNTTPEKLTNFLKDKYESKYKYEYVGGPKNPPKSEEDEEDKYTYRQQIIQGALSNDKNAINKMIAALPAGTTITPMKSFGTSKSKGGYNSLKIVIPGGYNDSKGNPVLAFDEIVEASRGEGAIKLNRILNQYTGEIISDSKLGIKGGKLAGEQFNVKVPRTAPKQQNKSDKDNKQSTYKTKSGITFTVE